MIGQGKNRWKYDFNCNVCKNKVTKHGDVYCVPISSGRKALYAGDDFVLRCSEFIGNQIDLFEEDK